MSTLSLASQHRVSQIAFHSSLPYLAVQSHERSVEIFRVRNEEEVLKKQARRKKRLKEKEGKTNAKGKSKVTEPDESINESIELADLFTPYMIVRASGKIRSFAFEDDEAISRSGGTQVTSWLTYSAVAD